MNPGDDAAEADRAYEYSSIRYGFGYDELAVSARIAEDGSATIERKVTVAAHARYDKLEMSLLMPEKDPEGRSRDVLAITVEALGTSSKAQRGKVIPSEGRLVAEILFSPPLLENTIASFKVTELLSRGVYAVGLSEKQIARRQTAFDYFGWAIDRPTRNFSMRAYFPIGYQPTGCALEVFYAPLMRGIAASQRQRREEKRYGALLSREPAPGGRYTLALDIRYPMVGLIYAIRWEPLTIEKVPSMETPIRTVAEPGVPRAF